MPWIIMVISISALLAVALLLTCCVCWEYKRRNLKDLHIFSKTTISDVKTKKAMVANTQKQSHKNVPLSKNFKATYMLANPTPKYIHNVTRTPKENELLESTDSINFDQVRLQIEHSEEREDALSYTSMDSKSTYYSIYPRTRASSVAETMKSALSQVDLNI